MHEPSQGSRLSQPRNPDKPSLEQARRDSITAMSEDRNDILSTSPKNSISRAVGKTVDKLGKSWSVKAPHLSPPTSPRRLFSLSKRGKPKERSSREDEGDPEHSSSPSRGSTSPPLFTRSLYDPLHLLAHDDSPFIRPPSPPGPAGLPTFRGRGSMRMGTQTLIQAIQAVPWADPDDAAGQDLSSNDSEGDDESPPDAKLASSIHTIHRPVARSRRSDAPPPHAPPLPSIPLINFKAYSPSVSDVEEQEAEAAVTSDDDDMEPADLEPMDFETTPRPPYAERPPQIAGADVSSERDRPLGTSVQRRQPLRTTSIGTVKIQRRARLAEKLKEVFELEGIEEVWAEMPCWLLRSILLQGYVYLTNTYICFFAHMPTKEDQVLKSGSLTKKASRTKRWIKHWFILKNDVLSWYQSSSDPYFPHGIVDLRYAISCDPLNDKEFRLRTHQKTIVLSADSIPSRDEWVKAIRKVMFKAQNMGESVKIAIPYCTIMDVEKSTAMDFSETIEVKVYDKEEQFSVDSYFFAYFHDLPVALDQIRDAVRSYRASPQAVSSEMVLDTTHRVPVQGSYTPLDRTRSLPLPDTTPRSPGGSGFSLTSLFKPFQDIPTFGRADSAPAAQLDAEDFTHISKRSSFVPITSSPPPTSPITATSATATTTDVQPESQRASNAGAKAIKTASLPVDHTYPPSTAPPLVSSQSEGSSGSYWTVGVPSWLKGPSKRIFSSPFASTATSSSSGLSEVYQSASDGHSASNATTGAQNDLGYSILEAPDSIDPEIVEKFRSSFAFDERETLLGWFTGYIFRLLPVYGRLYVSANFFCFKSSGPLATRTWMILPLRDVLSTEKSRATRFGHHGLVIIVKGHEELFFEFGLEDRRNAFAALLERQIEDVRKRLAAGDSQVQSPGRRDALILEEFVSQTPHTSKSEPATDHMTDSLPAVMFTSGSSTFLTFKPREPMHFTFLTIGSRGDVQPYIALAKGLLADGHRVKIATHGEFREWIESQNIEYGYVSGDPAELMRICVENGTFTVSFLKEGLQKFRGWVDDLLKTSWEACKGTDVLIESPSAMGGYHIAEALGIPYFRAFTMIWTRTRAYPHAFAVPDRKMGGGYNYMSYVIFDQVFWRATSGQINRFRKNILGLDSTSLDKMEPHKIPFLYNFSPVVVPPPLDWPEWIRVTGYWFLNDADVSAKKWQAPPDLVEFIDSAHRANKKVVYIGFGSIVVPDPRAMTRCVIDAVVQSGVCAILSKGWSDRLQAKSSEAAEPEEPLPKTIYPISSIPHDWLFQRIDAACHHGGAGTTGSSLRAGIPTIIKPFFGDQFFWADRMEALGVGCGVRKLTVDTLKEALITATTDRKQIERAKVIGEHIRAENGVAHAIECIYRDLEYARSLVKRLPADNADEDAEGATIREQGTRCPSRASRCPSRTSSSDRHHSSSSAQSEDWSVISDQEDRRSSMSSQRSDGSVRERSSTAKRNGLTAAVLSVLPEALTSNTASLRSKVTATVLPS